MNEYECEGLGGGEDRAKAVEPARSFRKRLEWYRARVAAMGTREIVHRSLELARQQYSRGLSYGWDAILPTGTLASLPGIAESARDCQADLAVVVSREAEYIRAGRFQLLGARWPEPLVMPPHAGFWHVDPDDGELFPQRDAYCFDIPYRQGMHTREVKRIWELSRLQFLVPLAVHAVIADNQEDANLVVALLRSWMAGNPPFRGLNWGSSIELALRIISVALSLSIIGCRILGVDLDSSKCQLALASGAEIVCGAHETEALSGALRISHGAGVDLVLLTTSTKENQPIDMAALLVRDRGRVVCLGNTQINLDWRSWFTKEIDFRFSRAMGAGMYDPDYFARGSDYPIGYVRWSASRNMLAVLDLLAQNKIDPSNLITHRFAFNEAVGVFNKIANGELSGAVGIVFRYPNAETCTPEIQSRTIRFSGDKPFRKVRLGMIGAGNYAKSMLLPHFSSHEDLSLVTICTPRGMSAEALAHRYAFRNATTDSAAIFDDSEINSVAVVTRHDSHAQYAKQALETGKSVYVEKPLAMNEEQLASIVEALGDRRSDGPTLWVGYNRRFAPLSRRAMEHMEGIPFRQVSCTIRSAGLPSNSWYQDPVEGGGILFGDVCHFIDLAIWFQRSLPSEVHALATRDPGGHGESWVIQLRFANGGLSTVNYVSGSQQGFVRETVDIIGGGRSARISAFRKLTLNDGRRARNSYLLQPKLGQKEMVDAMTAQFSRAPGAIDYTDSFIVATQALLAAHRSTRERRVVVVSPYYPYEID